MPFQVIPRELVFYDLLDEAARNVADGSGELLALVDDLGHAEQHASRLRELEHAGDELTHRIIATLNTTFGPQWLQPSLLQDGRMVQFSAMLTF